MLAGRHRPATASHPSSPPYSGYKEAPPHHPSPPPAPQPPLAPPQSFQRRRRQLLCSRPPAPAEPIPRCAPARAKVGIRTPRSPPPFSSRSGPPSSPAAPPPHRPGPAAARRLGAASTDRHPSNQGGESTPRGALLLFPLFSAAASPRSRRPKAAGALRLPPLFPVKGGGRGWQLCQKPLPLSSIL